MHILMNPPSPQAPPLPPSLRQETEDDDFRPSQTSSQQGRQSSQRHKTKVERYKASS